MDVELARHQWEEGEHRIERPRPERAVLRAQVELVLRELRKRVGQTFTLAELAAVYDGSDRWACEVIDLADPDAPPASEPGTVADAAFHQYARGATDYRP